VWFRFVFVKFVEKSGEALDARAPEGLVLGDPVDERLEAGGFGAVIDVATDATISYEAGAAQGGEVLGDGWLRDGEARGNLGDAGFAVGEAFEDGATGRIGERLQNVRRGHPDGSY
jgi:hypothetical protein